MKPIHWQGLRPARTAQGRTQPPRTAPAGLSGELNEWFELGLARRFDPSCWHEFHINGPCRIENALEQLPEWVAMTHSYQDHDDNAWETPWRRVLLDFDGPVAAVSRRGLQVFADDWDLARDVAMGLWHLVQQRPEPRPPMFQIIKKTSCGIEAEEIPLQRGGLADPATLALHYGPGFPDWHSKLAAAFNSRPTGITVLEGPPGTGKTSYIRHLMSELKDSHRFYFVPSSNLAVLKDDEFVEFWSGERRSHPERRLVVILEDAEEALMPRVTGNQAEVGVLLNITDGLLGDFLRLHVICTVNCRLDQLDPALLRPGRLVARHHFGRLPRAQAQAVADSIGKELPDADGTDFSLAEIFSGIVEAKNVTTRRLGFDPTV